MVNGKRAKQLEVHSTNHEEFYITSPESEYTIHPREGSTQICPGLNTNNIQISYDNHHKVSSFVKKQQNTYNYDKYEVISKCQITLLNMKYRY